MVLTISDHRRDSARLTYVYPVISRRAGGVSLGINLNPNHACNWACVYCQVPDLQRGGPPPIDLGRLETELNGFLEELLHGDFMAREVPPEARVLKDMAFSGDGEPTMAREFPAAVDIVVAAMARHGLNLPIRVITNGSQMHRPETQTALGRLAAAGGEAWFKVDAVGAARTLAYHGVRLEPGVQALNLGRCADHIPTWVQTCYFRLDGELPDAQAEADYLALLAQHRDALRGVLLYGLARPSCQPAAPRLSRATPAEMHALAEKIKGLPLEVVSNP